MKLSRILSLVLTLCMICSLFCVTHADEPENISGQFGENITWSLSDGVMTLSGKGSTFDYNEETGENPSIEPKYRGRVHTLVIEEGITVIGKNAFNGYYNLENVTFAASVERIEENAFLHSNLREVKFPENSAVSYIGYQAFSKCFSLTTADLSACKMLEVIKEKAFFDINSFANIVFPQNGVLSVIEASAFEKNTNIIRISIPDSVKTIGDMAFAGCNSLISAEIPASVTTIGTYAFKDTKAVIFGENGSEAQNAAKAHNLRFVEGNPTDNPVVIRQGNATETVSWTFDTNGTLVISGSGYIGDFPSSHSSPWYHVSNAMTSVIIEEGITGIGRENFSTFDNLKSVSIPSTLKLIGDYAFMGCHALEKIELPEGLATIGSHAFYCCRSLKEFHIPSTTYYVDLWGLYGLDSVERFTVADGNTAYFADEYGVLFTAKKNHLLKYPISSENKSYVIPAFVDTISPQAFSDSKYLEEVSFADGNTIDLIASGSFSNSSIKKITIPDTVKIIGGHAFSGTNLESINFPKGLETIEDWAFGRTYIETPEFPSTLKSIGNYTFSDCVNFKNIVLPEGILNVGAHAFSNCENLESIYLPASLQWIDPSISNFGVTKLSKVTVSPDNPYYSADENGALYYAGNTLVWYPSDCEIKTYTIPEGTTVISPNVFYGAHNLEEVILPASMTEIGSEAFSGCKGLKTITIPAGVKTIGSNAFLYCINLSEVKFEQGSCLETMFTGAFNGCSSLKEFYLPDSVTQIYSSTFSGCSLLENFYVGENSLLRYIDPYVFNGCPFVNIIAPEGSYADSYAKAQRIDMRITVKLDGEVLDFDVYPIIRYDRTLVPMRAIFEALGASVEWNEETRTVTSVHDGVEIKVTIDSTKMYVNGNEIELDSWPVIIADRTMVPVRAISEAFGCEVSWNDAYRTVDISTR